MAVRIMIMIVIVLLSGWGSKNNLEWKCAGGGEQKYDEARLRVEEK